MIDFAKLLHDKKGVSFLSFLIGMGIVILFFHKPYDSKRFLSIPVSEIERRVVKHGDKCYTYVAEDCLCSSVNKDAR
jgi:hypothetical protein